MKWADSKEVAAALAAKIHQDVQGRVVLLIDVPGTSYNEREAILRALARELENRGAVVHHLNGRKRLDALNQNQTDLSRHSANDATAERGAQ